jgi:hypothetical protein
MHAQRGALREAAEALDAARRRGAAGFRVDLLLADVRRREGRYDASLALLGRIVLEHAAPPILAQLWQTLYEAQLRQALGNLDVSALRERLLAEGFYLPPVLALSGDAAQRSAKSTNAGYDALLAGNLQAAEVLFEEALDAFPGNAPAHRGLGITWARRHDHRRAAGAYSLYLVLRPLAPDADAVDRALMRYWKRRRR